jgi:hypothetical protein
MSSPHIDAVPAAGRFDGIVGGGSAGGWRVLAERRVTLKHHYGVVIPGEVRFSIDSRDVEGLDASRGHVEPLVRAVASARHLAVDLCPMSSSGPVALSPAIQGLLEEICWRRGLSCMWMPGGAVHGAR